MDLIKIWKDESYKALKNGKSLEEDILITTSDISIRKMYSFIYEYRLQDVSSIDQDYVDGTYINYITLPNYIKHKSMALTGARPEKYFDEA